MNYGFHLMILHLDGVSIIQVVPMKWPLTPRK